MKKALPLIVQQNKTMTCLNQCGATVERRTRDREVPESKLDLDFPLGKENMWNKYKARKQLSGLGRALMGEQYSEGSASKFL